MYVKGEVGLGWSVELSNWIYSLEFQGEVQTGCKHLEGIGIEMIVKVMELKETTKSKYK